MILTRSIIAIGLLCVVASGVISVSLHEKFVNDLLDVSKNIQASHSLEAMNRIPTLSDNVCSHTCCPSEFGCSGGCICLTEEQKKALQNRGNNSRQASEY
jgi:hypothetical protein